MDFSGLDAMNEKSDRRMKQARSSRYRFIDTNLEHSLITLDVENIASAMVDASFHNANGSIHLISVRVYYITEFLFTE